MQLIIIRHAQSTNNCLNDGERVITSAEFEKSRSQDAALSALGERQIVQLGAGIENALRRPLSPKVRELRKLRSGPYAPRVRVAVSPMKRALCTAVPVIESVKNLHAKREIELRGVEVVPFIHETGGCYKEQNGSFVGFPGMNNTQVREIIPEVMTHESMESGWWRTDTRETEEQLELRIAQTVEWMRHAAWKGDCDVLIMISHQTIVIHCCHTRRSAIHT